MAVPWQLRSKQINGGGTSRTAFVTFKRAYCFCFFFYFIFINFFLLFLTAYLNIMSEKDIARQILAGYIEREIDLENQLKEM